MLLRPVNVFTDHWASFFLDPTKTKNSNHNTRLLRRIVLGQKFNSRAFAVVGKDNLLADILSGWCFEKETKEKTDLDEQDLIRSLQDPEN